MTVTLQEQWSISFEMRMTSAFGRGHHNFVNTKAGRYPGIYDPDQADPPSGFCCCTIRAKEPEVLAGATATLGGPMCAQPAELSRQVQS